MTMRKEALIGYTGFVGGQLAKQHVFNFHFNSKNINKIEGEKFDLVVCAGAPGAKWLANKYPEQDKKAILKLINSLSTIETDFFVLISTIDVYPMPFLVDETTEIEANLQHPYGKHRLELEEFVRKKFKNYLVIRLPALFGKGLKKNFIFDLIHNQFFLSMHPESSFQFYNIENLWKDIQLLRESRISLCNMVSTPLKAGEIAFKSCGITLSPSNEKRIINYNVRSICHGPWQHHSILTELMDFIRNEKIVQK